MNEAFEKIIERLEEKSFVDYDEYYTDNGECLVSMSDAIEIVNQVAEECKSLTEKFNDSWIPCSSGEVPKAHNEVWITYKWDDGSIHVGRDRVIHGEWHCTKREAIIAWQYMNVPAPYQPKEN